MVRLFSLLSYHFYVKWGVFGYIIVLGLHQKHLDWFSSSIKKASNPSQRESLNLINTNPSISAFTILIIKQVSALDLLMFNDSRWCVNWDKYQLSPDSGIPYNYLTTCNPYSGGKWVLSVLWWTILFPTLHWIVYALVWFFWYMNSFEIMILLIINRQAVRIAVRLVILWLWSLVFIRIVLCHYYNFSFKRSPTFSNSLIKIQNNTRLSFFYPCKSMKIPSARRPLISFCHNSEIVYSSFGPFLTRTSSVYLFLHRY